MNSSNCQSIEGLGVQSNVSGFRVWGMVDLGHGKVVGPREVEGTWIGAPRRARI